MHICIYLCVYVYAYILRYVCTYLCVYNLHMETPNPSTSRQDGQSATPPPSEGTQQGNDTAKQVRPVSPLQAAKSYLAKLTSAHTDCNKYSLQLESLQCDAVLVGTLQKLEKCTRKLYACFNAHVKKQVNDADVYAELKTKADRILEICSEKSDYAKAFLNVSKRRADPKAAAKKAAAKPVAI